MPDGTTDTGTGTELGRGGLTPADRRWLRGETEYAHAPTVSERKNSIRQRVHTSLLDYQVLLVHLPEELREQVFREEKVGEGSRAGVKNAVISAIAFLFLGWSDVTDGDETETFGEAIENAIAMAYERRGRAVESVSVEIEVERGAPLDELDRPLDELPEATLVQLMRSDRITLAEYTEAIKAGD